MYISLKITQGYKNKNWIFNYYDFTNLLAVGIFHADYENAQTDALIILFTGMASIFVIWKQDHPIIKKIADDFF